MKAYVQIALGSTNDTGDNISPKIYAKLKSIPEVEEVHMLLGDWDFMIKIDVPAEEMGDFVVNTIRAISGVRLTSTMIIAK